MNASPLDPTTQKHFRKAIPIIAVIRSKSQEKIIPAIACLIESGITLIEITLNTPHALAHIETARKKYGDQACIGAGTVLRKEDVVDVHRAGGQFIVSPNTNPAVIAQTKALKMLSAPGAFTATEILRAYDAGADMIKVFPCSCLGPQGIRSLRAVLPNDLKILATGGITIPKTHSANPSEAPKSSQHPLASKHSLVHYFQAGCWGVGLGSNLYNEFSSLALIKKNAQNVVAVTQALLLAT